jgi:hypothetical protein
MARTQLYANDRYGSIPTIHAAWEARGKFGRIARQKGMYKIKTSV